MVDHARATKYRLLEIARAARLLNEAGQQRLKKSYGRLLRLTRGVTSQAGAVLARLSRGELSARPDAVCRVLRQENSLRHYLPLVERVIAQTQARVFQAQRHYPEKLLSLFEPHSVVIRKGKAHKPNEFGRLVRIDEVEHSIVSAYEVAASKRPTSNNGHRRSSTMLPSLAGRRGWRRLIAVTGARRMSAWRQNWEFSR